MELFGFSTTTILVVAAIVLFYLYATWSYSTFTRLGIPGPTPIPLLGNMLTMMFSSGMQYVDVEWTKKYGKVFGTFEGRSPMLIVSDPEVIKQMCVKEFTAFYNRRRLPLESKPFDSALTNLTDENWKNKRNTLTPAFSASKMKMMSPLISHCADAMEKNLSQHAEEGSVLQCKNVFGTYVIDSVASAGFGVNINSQETPNHPFVANAKEAFAGGFFNPILLVIFFFPFVIPLLNYFNVGFFSKRITNYFLDLTEETISVRKNSEGTKRTDFLQLMMNAHDVYEEFIKNNEQEEDENGVKLVKDDKSDPHDFHKGFTNQEILGQSFIFFLAGYETTSTLMTFVGYSLATNPEIQVKVQEEIDEVMANYDTPNYEAVSKMHYLDMVISETLRMYPPAIRFDRECTADVTLGGYPVKKGMFVSAAVYAVHHNPDIYPEPDKFIPERFTKEEKEKRHPYAWLPFGAGPRNCIGMRFALLEAKIGLVQAFRNFTFEPCAETEIPPKLGKAGFTTPPAGVKLKVKRRE